MFYRLAFMLLEALLASLRLVDTTRRRLRQDYPAMHGVRR